MWCRWRRGGGEGGDAGGGPEPFSPGTGFKVSQMAIPSWSMASPKRRLTNAVLLAICAVLIGFGILIITVSSGFFMNLLGAGTMASGGSAAYLILSHRK